MNALWEMDVGLRTLTRLQYYRLVCCRLYGLTALFSEKWPPLCTRQDCGPYDLFGGGGFNDHGRNLTTIFVSQAHNLVITPKLKLA